MLREVRAALAVAQAMQDMVQPAAGTGALIPKPRGTSGRGGFNLANKMKVNTEVCHQIQVTLGARVPKNEWEHLRNISRSGSILLHCNQQTHLWHI